MKYHIDRLNKLLSRTEFKDAQHQKDFEYYKAEIAGDRSAAGRAYLSSVFEYLPEWAEIATAAETGEGWARDLKSGASHFHFVTSDSFEAGSNIFDMSALVPAFRRSSVDAIKVSDIKLPFDYFYLHFGPEHKIRTPYDGSYIDGAYVGRTRGGGILVTFVCSPGDDEDPLKMQPIDAAKFYLRMNTLWFEPQIEDFYLEPIKDNTVKDLLAFVLSDEYENEMGKIWKSSIEDAAKIAFNSLCYLCYDKKDVFVRFPKEAPKSLTRKATEGSQKQRKRTASKLLSLGFRKVIFCGTRTQPRENPNSLGTHWRRGHWRNQLFGKNLERSKLIWIQPTLVNAEAATEIDGHTYKVKDEGIAT